MRIWKPAKLPDDTSIVAFTGKPDPEDVLNEKWPVPRNKFYKKIYKQVKCPDWLIKNWKINSTHLQAFHLYMKELCQHILGEIFHRSLKKHNQGEGLKQHYDSQIIL